MAEDLRMRQVGGSERGSSASPRSDSGRVAVAVSPSPYPAAPASGMEAFLDSRLRGNDNSIPMLG